MKTGGSGPRRWHPSRAVVRYAWLRYTRAVLVIQVESPPLPGVDVAG